MYTFLTVVSYAKNTVPGTSSQGKLRNVSVSDIDCNATHLFSFTGAICYCKLHACFKVIIRDMKVSVDNILIAVVFHYRCGLSWFITLKKRRPLMIKTLEIEEKNNRNVLPTYPQPSERSSQSRLYDDLLCPPSTIHRKRLPYTQVLLWQVEVQMQPWNKIVYFQVFKLMDCRSTAQVP